MSLAATASRSSSGGGGSRSTGSATRTVQLARSRIGFGFTINGQSPCVLSCIVPNSPADLAGLRPGDALLAVNGRHVDGMPHDDVACAIAQCGTHLTLLLIPVNPTPPLECSLASSPPPPPPPRHSLLPVGPSDPRVIGPEARYEQVQQQHHQRHRRQSLHRIELPREFPRDVNRLLMIQNPQKQQQQQQHFVLSYIGSVSVPASAIASSSAALARLKSEARDVSLAVLTITEEVVEDQASSPSASAVVTLTSCSGRVLFRLTSPSPLGSGSGGGQQLLGVCRHPDDARYCGVVCRAGSGGFLVHGFFANPRLASGSGGGHSTRAGWAAVFGIPCLAAAATATAAPPSLSSASGYCSCAAAFPADCGPVLAALKPLLPPVPTAAPQQQPLQSSASSSSSSSLAAGVFKVPQPPGDPQQQMAFSSSSLFRRFARGASGSFRRLRRRSVALSAESLNSSASESDGFHPPQQQQPQEQQLLQPPTVTSGHLLNTSGHHHRQHLPSASSEQNLSSLGLGSSNSAEENAGEDAAANRNCDGIEGLERSSSVARWATGLRHLLEDPAGVSVFTEFLRLEFSQENIAFWLAVEEFKRLTQPDELRSAANQIATSFIGANAPSSVNVDSCTVDAIHSGLASPNPTMFDSAQLHIFNLMRLDSYARFLKSRIYKDSLLNELQGSTGTTSSSAAAAASEAPVERGDARAAGKLQSQQHRSSRGFLASLMRGRSSKRYHAGTTSTAAPARVNVDILVGFRRPQQQRQHQSSVWMAFRTRQGQPFVEAVRPAAAALRSGNAAASSARAVQLQPTAATTAASSLMPWERPLTRAEHHGGRFALFSDADVSADDHDLLLTGNEKDAIDAAIIKQMSSDEGGRDRRIGGSSRPSFNHRRLIESLLADCPWSSSEAFAAAADSGKITFDSDGVCELQIPQPSAPHPPPTLIVTSSPRHRPASTVPAWRTATSAATSTSKDDSLVELLARVQGSRMDDQRGRIGGCNLELPEFLRPRAATTGTVGSLGKENNLPPPQPQPPPPPPSGMSASALSPHKPIRIRARRMTFATISPPGQRLSTIARRASDDSVAGANVSTTSSTARSSTPSPTTHLLLPSTPVGHGYQVV